MKCFECRVVLVTILIAAAAGNVSSNANNKGCAVMTLSVPSAGWSIDLLMEGGGGGCSGKR